MPETLEVGSSLMDESASVNEMINASMTLESVSTEYFDHIKKINDIYYDQIKISDQKAAYIFTFMLAFLVTSDEGRGVFTITRYNSGSMAEMLCSAFLAIASLISIVFAIMVVLPRHAPKSTTLFWGAWSSHRSSFIDAATRRDAAYLFEQYVANADVLAEIARGKYRCVRYAFRGLLATVSGYVLLLVASGSTPA